MRGEPNWHFDTLNRPDGGQGSRGQKHLCESVSVVAHCLLFQVCLFVVGFGLHEWRIMVHTLVTWVLTGSAENVGRGNKPGN